MSRRVQGVSAGAAEGRRAEAGVAPPRRQVPGGAESLEPLADGMCYETNNVTITPPDGRGKVDQRFE